MSGPAAVLPLVMPAFAEAAVRGALARAMTSPGGAGTAADVRLVRAELQRMPLGALQIMTNNKTKVVVCRDNITDYRTDLKGQPPRGWDPGDTWEKVPGLYNSKRNELVVATIGHGTPAGAHVPATGEQHGSHNLVMHEAFHAVDLGHGGAARSTEADFNTARTADLGTLSDYEKQGGKAGQQETYAESAARFFGGDPNDATNHPNLHDFWAKNPPQP